MKLIKRVIIPLLCVIPILFSCNASLKTQKERLYLQGIDTAKGISTVIIPKRVISKGDMLGIMIYSDNPQATQLYNQPQTGGGNGIGIGTSSQGAVALSALTGYEVDNEGCIYIQEIGKIKVTGLSKDELTQLLQEKLKVYLKNPYVIIKYVGNMVTLEGEVNRPGQIDISNQRISILDAIGMAGDLTSFGRRDNILIVREKDGNRNIARLDIRDPQIFQSPYFYLQQNDLVYVETNRKKTSANDQIFLRNLTIATTSLSLLTIIISLLR